MKTTDDLSQLWECVRILTRKLGLLEKSEASCCGVSLTQCHVLVELGRAGSISVNYLANLLGLDKSTMSRTINTLVEQDLVTRETDPRDRRCLSIGLTGKGHILYLKIENSMKQYYQAACASLLADKREQVLESLEIMVNSLPGQCC
jgi:DNA-binding MarR family transcriptional regulator